MLPKTILTFLIANSGQIKKVFNKRYRRKIFKFLILFSVPVSALYIFAPSTFNFLLNYGQQNIGQVLGISTSISPEIDKVKFDNAKDINSKVTIGNIQWDVLETSIPAKDAFSNINPDYCIPQDGFKFIKIKYLIQNIDRDLLAIPKYNLNIYDANKVEYPFSKKTFMCVLQNTNPFYRYAPDFLKRGESKTFEVLFEIPADKKDFKLKVGDLSVLTEDYEYIRLGI